MRNIRSLSKVSTLVAKINHEPENTVRQRLKESGRATCFKSNPIDCTLLARWDADYADPWLILTDLKPVETDVSWYGFRSWIECSYRDLKSDGFGWHKTRLRQPDRAEREAETVGFPDHVPRRHWLAMSVAMGCAQKQLVIVQGDR